MTSLRGRFIVVEGLEGAGKSTAIKTLTDLLQEAGCEWLVTREPGGTAVGDMVRHLVKDTESNEPLDAKAELLLFYAARVQLLEQVIRPALARGVWVLADRFEWSTFAYQGGGRKVDADMLSCLSSFCVGDLTPDLIVFLDITPKTGLLRAGLRGSLDRMEQESETFFTDVYNSYHDLIKTATNVQVVDASQSLSEVVTRLRTVLTDYLSQYGY
jgi:dTMP kinase